MKREREKKELVAIKLVSARAVRKQNLVKTSFECEWWGAGYRAGLSGPTAQTLML